MIEYQGYTGVFEFDAELALFAGHVVDLRDEIYFEGGSVEDLTASMQRAVDHYLEVCTTRGEQPERPFSGRFNVRVNPDIHREVATAAAAAGLSMNEWLVGLIEAGLGAIDRGAEVLVLDDFRKRVTRDKAQRSSRRSPPRKKTTKPRAAKTAAARKTAKAAVAKPKAAGKTKRPSKAKTRK